MKRSILPFVALLLCSFAGSAQTADEIIAKYFENTGGKAKWETLQGLKITAKANAQGMELPVNMVVLKDGRQTISFTLQGMEIRQQVYDGTVLWGTNFQSMKAEKSDAESTENFIANLGSDFPNFPIPLLEYSSRGYKAELLGKETIDGSETYKIKLTKKPVKVDGVETENVEFYYFDTEDFIPLVIESEVKTGPAKGMVSLTKLSDYQEVGGLTLAFSMTSTMKGQPGGQTITFNNIEVDPAVDAAVFAFPAGN